MIDWVNGEAKPQTNYAAVYFPRLETPDPLKGNDLRSVGPSGTLAGIYAASRALDTPIGEIRVFSRDEKKQHDMRLAYGEHLRRAGHVVRHDLFPAPRSGVQTPVGPERELPAVVVLLGLLDEQQLADPAAAAEAPISSICTMAIEASLVVGP